MKTSKANNKYKLLETILSMVLIMTVLLAFFNRQIFRNEFFITGDFLRSDTLHQNLPFKKELFESVNQRIVPFWTNEIFNGYPLYAEGQIGFFYPINTFLYAVTNFVQAYNLSIFINFVIAALGLFLFCKKLKLGNLESVFASIAFSLSASFVLHITHQNIISSAVWIPWIFLAITGFFDKKSFIYFLSSVLFIALSILGGSMQIIFYTLVMVFIYTLVSTKDLKKKYKKVIAFFVSITTLALGLVAFQVLPTLELVGESTRESGLGNLALNSLPYHPRNLITVIFPYAYGDPGIGTYPRFGESWGMFWENTLYVGILTLIFSLFTLLYLKKDTVVRNFWILVFVSLLLALGKYSPLFLVYYLPVFNTFRVTSRFLVFISFSLSILSAFGIRYFIQRFKGIHVRSAFVLLIIGILVLDLFKFGYYYNPSVAAEKVLAEPESADYLKEKGITGRVFTVASFITYDAINDGGWRGKTQENINHKNALDADINMLWDINNTEGYAGLFIRRNEVFKNMVYRGLSQKEDKIVMGENSEKLLQLSNVEYLISSFELESDNIEYVEEFGDNVKYKIYKLMNTLPKGVLIDSAEIATFAQAEYKMSQEGYDISDDLYIEHFGDERITGNTQEVEDKVELLEETNSYKKFKITSNQDKWLLVQDTYFPGWEAKVNGQNVDLYPANVTFKALMVPSGESEVELEYGSTDFKNGVWLSVFSLVLILGIGIINSKRNILKNYT